MVERIARWSGVLWAALLTAQWVIALHDELVLLENRINYSTLSTSSRISNWLIGSLILLNLWAILFRVRWRDDPPPHLGWLIAYNFRVMVFWGLTQTGLGILTNLTGLPFHTWLGLHISLSYAIATTPALFGVILLLTRRWRPVVAAVTDITESLE